MVAPSTRPLGMPQLGILILHDGWIFQNRPPLFLFLENGQGGHPPPVFRLSWPPGGSPGWRPGAWGFTIRTGVNIGCYMLLWLDMIREKKWSRRKNVKKWPIPWLLALKKQKREKKWSRRKKCQNIANPLILLCKWLDFLCFSHWPRGVTPSQNFSPFVVFGRRKG